jgi:cell division protein FtsW (lipid II flippase)
MKMIDRLARLFGRAMYVLYVVAAVVITRPDLSSSAAWLLGAVALAIVLRLTTRDLSEVLRAAAEFMAAWKGERGKDG